MPYPFIKNYQKLYKAEDKNVEDEQRKKHIKNIRKKTLLKL